MLTLTASSLQKMGGSSKDFRSAALGSLCSIPRTAVCESESYSRRQKRSRARTAAYVNKKQNKTNQAKI